MEIKKIKAIAWDLDGTIVPFKIDFMGARKAVIKILKKHGIPKNNLSIQNSILDTVRESKVKLKEKGYSDKKIEEVIKKIETVVSEIEHEAAVKATMVKGIDKVIDLIKEKKIKQAIYTYNTNKNAKTSLDKIKLRHYFDIIAGRDDVKNPKPHPDHLKYICNGLNVKPSEILVIGDTYRDIQGALNVNARSIAIKTKISNLSNIEIFQKADKIINNDDIPSKLLNAINYFL